MPRIKVFFEGASGEKIPLDLPNNRRIKDLLPEIISKLKAQSPEIVTGLLPPDHDDLPESEEWQLGLPHSNTILNSWNTLYQNCVLDGDELWLRHSGLAAGGGITIHNYSDIQLIEIIVSQNQQLAIIDGTVFFAVILYSCQIAAKVTQVIAAKRDQAIAARVIHPQERKKRR